MPEKKSGRPTLYIAAILVIAVFAAGLIHLFLLRFQRGDELPPYSTLRADPLGAKALFESLGRLPELNVQRNYAALSGIEDGQGRTLFLLGTDRYQLDFIPVTTIQALDAFLVSGGRLVFALAPDRLREESTTVAHPKNSKQEPEAEPLKPPADAKSKNDKENNDEAEAKPENGKKPVDDSKKTTKSDDKDEKKPDSRATRYDSLAEHWGLSIGDDAPLFGKPEPRALARWAKPPLPSEITWKSNLYFDSLDPAWRVLYARAGRPVIAERNYGAGRLVLVADSYLFSNEGLRDARQPELLAWLVGPNATVLFDETHLGVVESPGIASLGRKYRLHGLLAGLALLAILFIWKNAIPLTPPQDDRSSSNGLVASGRDYTEGLIGLLRRNIPAGQILAVCVKEWTGSARHRPDIPAGTVEKAEAVLTGSGKHLDPIQDYRRICRIIDEERKSWPTSPNT